MTEPTGTKQPTPEWAKTLSPAEVLQKVPEAALALAIDYAPLAKQPERERIPNSIFLAPSTGPDMFGNFLKERGLTVTQFALSLVGTGCDPVKLHHAVKTIGVDVAQKVLENRLSEAKQENRTLVEISPEGLDAKMLIRLAETSPAGFTMARDFILARNAAPQLQLADHLQNKGIAYTDYFNAVGSNPGDILMAMQKMPVLTAKLAHTLPAEAQAAPLVEAKAKIPAR